MQPVPIVVKVDMCTMMELPPKITIAQEQITGPLQPTLKNVYVRIFWHNIMMFALAESKIFL